MNKEYIDLYENFEGKTFPGFIKCKECGYKPKIRMLPLDSSVQFLCVCNGGFSSCLEKAKELWNEINQ